MTLSIQRTSCSVGSLSGTAHPADDRDPNIGSPSSACVTIADDGAGDDYDYLPSNTLQEEFDDKPTYPCTEAGSTGALRGRFVSPPERHDGKKAVEMQVAFTRSVYASEERVGEHGVRVRGGRVISSTRVGRQPVESLPRPHQQRLSECRHVELCAPPLPATSRRDQQVLVCAGAALVETERPEALPYRPVRISSGL
ncbi:hypothetical protein [Candidatus Palauibacter sp.]|uniref:hypothetical protein n=1 Tax=Candidatus Palauibacter sp. TaxID=3101350 RepID=UPI003B5B69D3